MRCVFQEIVEIFIDVKSAAEQCFGLDNLAGEEIPCAALGVIVVINAAACDGVINLTYGSPYISVLGFYAYFGTGEIVNTAVGILGIFPGCQSYLRLEKIVELITVFVCFSYCVGKPKVYFGFKFLVFKALNVYVIPVV